MRHVKFKKISIFTSLMLALTLILGACGNKADVTKDITNNDTNNDIEETAPGEDPADTGESYGFKKFELEVDYSDQEESLEVNYEEKKDSTDAKYKNLGNDITLDAADDNIDVDGDEAMAQLRPLLTALQLKEDMVDEEILSQVIKTFNIEENYTEIEVDITWFNDEKSKIEVTK
ncbi:YusW family protein [Paenisporosarcina antarctica]|uniref:YusW-like protein n=1 Tax=Paenisporosarcina antarctica TaxID=417367 RepID=A0A4P7A1R8_9BACL|nr:YusW family protein [Paenisporosarcina antarctica]QBP42812.1 hypothetical protein E2636_17435 [Paenisporosarcina antarctica]